MHELLDPLFRLCRLLEFEEQLKLVLKDTKLLLGSDTRSGYLDRCG